MEVNLAQIIAAQRHSSEGPVPASLLPFAMCSQVSPTLSSKPLADRLDLLTGGRAQVSNQSGDTLPSNFVLVLGLATCIGGGIAKVDGTTTSVLISQCYQSQMGITTFPSTSPYLFMPPGALPIGDQNSLLNCTTLALPSTGGHICGYVQFRTRCLRSISECQSLWWTYC